MHKTLLAVAAVAAFAAGFAASVAWRDTPPTELIAGTRLEPARPLQPFALRRDGVPTFDNESLTGRWSLVFFGFTRCPDICPLTLQLLADARAQLDTRGSGGVSPQIVLVSVDPTFDTPDRLAAYAAHFGDDVIGVTADDDSLAAFAQQLGVLYQRVDLGEGAYTLDHSGAVLLIDPDGAWRAVFSPPLVRDTLVADLDILLTE